MTTTKTIQAFIQDHGLTMTVKPVDDNPNMADPMPGASHWLCTITRGASKMEVPYSQGGAYRQWNRAKLRNYYGTWTGDELAKITAVAPTLGGRNPITGGPEVVALRELREQYSEPTPPDLAGVLECLAMDASGYDCEPDFEAWAESLGLDTDSRKAEKSYRVTGDQSKRLRHLLGDAAYAELLALEF